MRRLLPVLLPVLLAVLLPAGAMAGPKQLAKIEDCIAVLDDIMNIPDEGMPESLLRNSYAIAIVPNVIKVGFFVGGRRGRGVLLVRTPSGAWSNPSFVTLTGGSLGFQIGAQSTDVILVFKTQRSVDGIVRGKFTLGADAAVAAGPVGRRGEAATDAQLKAEIYSYSRSRGLFAGVSLEGSAIQIDYEDNQKLYGESGIGPRELFAGRPAQVPGPVAELKTLLDKRTRPPAVPQ
jgi:lipid-binding SYLF domain-containing protein